MQSASIILETRGVSCSKPAGGETAPSISKVSLAIQAKTVNLIAGGTQGGADIMLRMLSLLDVPEEGEILFRGEAVGRMGEDVRADLRSRHYGFLFSQPFLLPSFSVIENVAMPLFKLSGAGPDEAQERTQALLEFAGMGRCPEVPVTDLTIPQQHRISLARALVNNPDILILENIDAEMSGGELSEFFEIVRRVTASFDTTVIFTASQKELTRFADRVIEMEGGAIHHDSQPVAQDGGAKV